MVREAVGPDIQICFDVHTRLDTAHAVSLCKTLEPFRPFFIEDPLRSENPASYRTLARHVSLPIAAGEQWASKWSFREAIEEELISYARIDLCIVGGLTEALKVTHWAEDPLHRHRSAQSSGSRERGGVRQPLHGIDQRRRPGDASAAGQLRHRPVSEADRVGRRLRVGAGRTRARRRLRRGGRRVESGAGDRLAAAAAPQRRSVYQLVAVGRLRGLIPRLARGWSSRAP